MRLMIMFDVPTETAQERKEYRQFRNGTVFCLCKSLCN